MSFVGRLKRLAGRVLTDPLSLPGYLFPDRYWRSFDARARAAGIDRLYLVLSFDCDTVKDAEVVLGVDARLRDMGAAPVYAVPGEVLTGARGTYSELARRGAEFLNHGHVLHTLWHPSTGRYESCFFYNELTEGELLCDIEAGHRAIRQTLGLEATGFRAPHFGCLGLDQLCLMHRVLGGLGYQFSTSTVPEYAFSHGCIFSDFGLPEMPVSGWWRQPFNIQDSWGYMAAPGAGLGGAGYLDHARETARQLGRRGYAGVLNYYADPSQVYDKEEFFEAVRSWMTVATVTTYSELLSLWSEKPLNEEEGHG